MSGTRAVRSASQPKIGSPTSRAAGQAAMTSPSSRQVDALLGEVERQDRAAAPPNPSHTMNSASSSGTIAPQRSSHAAGRAVNRARGDWAVDVMGRRSLPGSMRSAERRAAPQDSSTGHRDGSATVAAYDP